MRIAVAMSGGLDSSVVAALLKAEGHEVVGVSMAVWRNSLCCSFEDVARARLICRQLGIQHYLIDLVDEFKTQIVQAYVQSRLHGETPNPCTQCNRDFKLGLMWERLLQRTKAEALATGHYVKSVMDPQTRRHMLAQADDLSRDQSYMLWTLSQEQLARSLFPLGHWQKSEVRELARELDLTVLEGQRESQDLCFVVPNRQAFWAEQVPAGIETGLLMTASGETVGRHKGLPFYTLGQRKGLEHNRPERLYVTALDPEHNVIRVGPASELEVQQLHLESLNLFLPPETQSFRAQAQLRLHGPSWPVAVDITRDIATLNFSERIPLVARGQSVVCYDAAGRVLLGGIARGD